MDKEGNLAEEPCLCENGKKDESSRIVHVLTFR